MVPGYVKLIVGLTSAVVMTAGLRDIFAPGTGLPLPDDDKTIAAVFGAPPVGACGKKAVGCVPGRMLFVSQGWGLMAVTMSAVKLVALFSHPEGTFLRRNLFATLGASSVGFAYIINSHESYFNEQDASAMGFALLFALEGIVLLYDALLHPPMWKPRGGFARQPLPPAHPACIGSRSGRPPAPARLANIFWLPGHKRRTTLMVVQRTSTTRDQTPRQRTHSKSKSIPPKPPLPQASTRPQEGQVKGERASEGRAARGVRRERLPPRRASLGWLRRGASCRPR